MQSVIDLTRRAWEYSEGVDGKACRRVVSVDFLSVVASDRGPPCALGALRPSEAPRLVRADLDTDERIGSRDLGGAAFIIDWPVRLHI